MQDKHQTGPLDPVEVYIRYDSVIRFDVAHPFKVVDNRLPHFEYIGFYEGSHYYEALKEEDGKWVLTFDSYNRMIYPHGGNPHNV